MGIVSTDPRGPLRTVKAVESTPEVHLVTFEECEHTAQLTRHAWTSPGDRWRCFHCGPHGQAGEA